MIDRDQLLNNLNKLLEVERFQDYCPNGLQIEGKREIKKIVSAVSASQYIIEQAIQLQADALLVHHGYFWKGEDNCITGIKKQRIARLLSQDINLFAYHLPLDAHLTYGNNIQLGNLLGITFEKTLDNERYPGLVFQGSFPSTIKVNGLSQRIHQALQREALHIASNKSEIKTIVWCTGAAQDAITFAIQAGADAFLSGEVSERTYHLAKEANIHYFAAGHHATERYGVQALGNYIAAQYNLQHIFIDEPNPV